MKVCRDRNGRGCGQTLPLDRFYTSRGRHVNVCKDCYRDIYSRGRSTRRARTAQAEARAFGVELELTGPNGRVIADALSAAGININYIGRYRATNGSTWELKSDCSVRGMGLELVSPKLRGDAGFAELETVCRTLNQVGATVDRSCGLHVHHDMRNATVSDIKTQALAFLTRQHLVMNMMAPSRRSNHYCPTWSESYISRLRQATTTGDLNTGPRGALNMASYGRHGSVEMRCHAGTTNFKKIRAFVHFGQALFAAALAGSTVRSDSTANMLADLTPHGLTAEDASWLLRFETSGESRRDVEARVAALRQQVETVESTLEEMSV